MSTASKLIFPTSVRAISDTFADHVARKSVNPGTDYECPVGTPVVSVAAGVVTDAHDAPDGSGGKRIHVNHDDGTGADYLHLSGISVSYGQHVDQGQRLGYSGASGYNDASYYGPHLHISYRPNHSEYYGNVGNVDFDAACRAAIIAAGGGSTPIAPSPEEDDMKGKFLRAPDTSMGYIGPDGVLIPLKNMDEVRSYEYIGWATQAETQSVTSLVWASLTACASRTK